MTSSTPKTQAPVLFRPATVVGLLTVLALGLRMITYRDSLFGDEYYALQELAAAHSPSGLLRVLSDSPEVSPPMYFLLAWLTRQVSNSLTALRLPSVAAGTLLIPVVYAIGRRAAGTRTGLAAAALAMISPFAVWFSGEGRPYALLCLLSALMILCLLRAVEEATVARCALVSLTAAGAAYTHYTAIFVIAGGYAWSLAVARGQRRRIAASAAGALLLYLPWASSVSGKQSLDMYGQTHGLGLRMARLIAEHTLLGVPFVPLEDVPGIPLAVAAASAIAVGAASRVRHLPQPDSPMVLLLIAATLPLAGLSVYSLATDVNLLMVRNMNSAFPAFVVLAATAVVNAKPPWLAAAATITLFTATAISLSSSFQAEYRRPDLIAAGQLIGGIRPSPAVASNARFRYYLPAEVEGGEVILDDSPARVWRELALSGTPIAFVALRWPYPNNELELERRRRNLEAAGFRLRCAKNIKGLIDTQITIHAPASTQLRVPWRCESPTRATTDARRKLLAVGANGTSVEDLPMSGSDYVLAILTGAWLVSLAGYMAFGASRGVFKRARR